MVNPRIYSVLDRLAHDSTTGHDLAATVAGFRRLLNGTMPSDLLSTGDFAPSPHRSYDDWQDEITRLRANLKDLQGQKTASERHNSRQIKGLIAEIAKLQVQIERLRPQARTGGTYTYGEVMQVMITKFGKHHGVGAALVERSTRLTTQGVPTPPITDAAYQKWRLKNAFPSFVIEQITAMTTDDLLPRVPWSDEERDYLVTLYTQDQRQPNKALAVACSAKFGRRINERSVKGELTRLRGKGRISQYR